MIRLLAIRFLLACSVYGGVAVTIALCALCVAVDACSGVPLAVRVLIFVTVLANFLRVLGEAA